ncbi:MAG: 3-oxoacyl-ACP reductase FabG [Candidatus Thiodiazotropha sp. (ex Myrtea spinifera)]|nr:3-oxoacyl-ACP reductase FabG [Candidatus Thiodiazotropha sp. (ex Myrtea spinifera)]MCU7830967.1 3-oxoacyl-ACP reductase FabG [Candidatus Thiodiazotropha sp. (ex Myrtea sp. 'scaly one' KF741663)]
MSLENEVALVTGASRGIGAAIADKLAEAGATVIGTATSEKGADAISERMQAAGQKGIGMVLNVSEQDSVDALMKAISDAYGNPTILVNNAGITRDNLLMRMKDDEWESIINTNLTSVFRLSKAVLRGMMKARKGRVINISSVVGAMGNAGQTNYAAAKAGIHGFTRSMAREVGSRGITVNSVAPGFIETDMTKSLPEAQRKALEENIPLQKLGQPEDIANTVLFLASESGRYITGETLHVNGGMYMG